MEQKRDAWERNQPKVEMMAHEDIQFEDAPSYQVLRPRHDKGRKDILMTRTDFEDAYLEEGKTMEEIDEMWENSRERDPPLLETKYRLGHGADVNVGIALKEREGDAFLQANSTAGRNACYLGLAWAFAPCFAPCLYGICRNAFEVPVGTVLPLEDGRGNYLLAGEGIHHHCTPFMRVGETGFNYSTGTLVHGDWCIVVVGQGFIGLAFDKGQPVLLPPGFHQWKSTTLKFDKLIDLNEPVIYLGPYTLLTVDEGYAAVTQNNGKQEIKRGGTVHLLTHRNHKFEKFLTTKIQTNTLERIEVITADNVLMLVDATVNWKISNVEMAAKNAAETMKSSSEVDNIKKLRNDVLKQASASLSSFIGTVNYSDTFSPNAQVQQSAIPFGVVEEGTQPVVAAPQQPQQPQVVQVATPGVLFDTDRMSDAVFHANAITLKYGVEIISINIISAKPADPQLMNMLAKGAVAAAEAQQMETTARGQAKSVKITATAEAEAKLITAQAEAEAEETRARGSKQAAELLHENPVAVTLAKIRETGNALSTSNATHFFGSTPQQLDSILANSAVVPQAKGN